MTRLLTRMRGVQVPWSCQAVREPIKKPTTDKTGINCNRTILFPHRIKNIGQSKRSEFMGTPIHTTTEHKIGTVTYLVVSAPSENAAETLDKKVEKLIRKDMRETAAKRRFRA